MERLGSTKAPSINTYGLLLKSSAVIGSYTLIDNKEQKIGYWEGPTIKRRFTSFSFEQIKNQYSIIKSQNRYYLILLGEDIKAALKLSLRGTPSILRFNNDNEIHFSFNLGLKSIKIKQDRKEIGFIHSENWIRNNIYIALETSPHFEYIICAIAGIVYALSSPPLRIFDQ